ncbi:MAG: hypothetical protein V3U74_03230 [Thermodesulfobacteriota bacterium]
MGESAFMKKYLLIALSLALYMCPLGFCLAAQSKGDPARSGGCK